ncbi:hypothetical protein HUK80_13350 [Flavobacterium sp. MAH-1]|uniref:Uncharacterized protein n=1 Tax=Flavobacterium agri TaxID=2743471 RepID=A0A7Y8Y4T3_9FLAO|nr:hypothetical protein [Flavobacterium agri]NUY81884.1 hypothetical protein [Flavobacterium agri]NYA71908.1 hypothetical protein [Flavobacterium agri]
MKKVIIATVALAGLFGNCPEACSQQAGLPKNIDKDCGDTGGTLPVSGGKKVDYAPCGDLWYLDNDGSMH